MILDVSQITRRKLIKRFDYVDTAAASTTSHRTSSMPWAFRCRYTGEAVTTSTCKLTEDE